MDPWVFWLIAAVIFGVGEIATLGFFLAPFAIGALWRRSWRPSAAARSSPCVVFLLVSGVILGALRPLARSISACRAAAHGHRGADRPDRDRDRAHPQRRGDGLRQARGRELDRAFPTTRTP